MNTKVDYNRIRLDYIRESVRKSVSIVQRSQDYDGFARLKTIDVTNHANNPILNYAYQYDNAHNIIQHQTQRAYGGEFDFGVLGSASAGGSWGLGTGKLTGSFTFSEGGVREQGGDSVELSFNDGIGGLAICLDDDNRPTSVGIHIGPGLEVAADEKLTGFISLRDQFDRLFDCIGGRN